MPISDRADVVPIAEVKFLSHTAIAISSVFYVDEVSIQGWNIQIFKDSLSSKSVSVITLNVTHRKKCELTETMAPQPRKFGESGGVGQNSRGRISYMSGPPLDKASINLLP